MTDDISDRQAFFEQCDRTIVEQAFTTLSSVIRNGFRRVLEVGPQQTIRVVQREVLKSRGACALDETADAYVAKQGFSNQLLDQTLLDARYALLECIKEANKEVGKDIPDLVAKLTEAIVQRADHDVIQLFYDQIEPALVEVYRQWLLKGYTWYDLELVADS